MAKLSNAAQIELEKLVKDFLDKGREEAAIKLIDAVNAALLTIDHTKTWLPAPRPYPQIARYGYRWIKQHRYWIAYKLYDGTGSIIHYIVFDESNLPGRVTEKNSE